MIANIKIRFRFPVALLLVALICSACGARQVEPTSTNPLLSLLSDIPQDPINQKNEFVYFIDYSAMESAYNATRPADAEEFANLRDSDETYKVWGVVWRNLTGLIQEPWLALESMPQTVGFSALEVDQAIQFGAPPGQGLILAGDFDADAIRTAYQANFALEQKDLDGKTVWCWAKDCADGARKDPKYRMRENPFGGALGQRQPLIIGEEQLMAAADLELVLAHLDATAGAAPNLADDSSYLAAVNAVSKDADVVQSMIANPTVAQRIADRMPIDERLPADKRTATQETMLETFQELPPFELLILADAVTEDEQIARLGIVYKDADTAERAAPILLERLAGHQSVQFQRPFTELLTEYKVTDPRYFVHQGADRATLVLEFPTQKATPKELVQMGENLFDYEGTTTPPGLLYRLFFQMFMMDETSWLSTASRAELEAIQGRTITIDAPDDSSRMLIDGAGDKFTYYASEESPPEEWEDVNSGTLWICSEDERPPLIPKSTVNQLDGGGFQPGTKLNLTWSDQPGAPDSSELGITKIIVTIGVTYEGCIKAAQKAMENSTTLLLTETDSKFDGKDRLVVVEFY